MSQNPVDPPRQPSPALDPALDPVRDPARDPALDPVVDAGGPGDPGSTADVAKDQAAEIKETSKAAGQQVVEETKQQAATVAAEAKNQTSDLLRQGIGEFNSQAGQQQQRLAGSVHSLAKELGAMASASDQSGPMTGLVQDASRRGGEIAQWLETHEPNDILDGLRSFARRRPGTFLLGAAAAGVLVGRLARGMAGDAGPELPATETGVRDTRLLPGEVGPR
ncbi:hypothetical protein GCM10011575_34210 [Microlunatus endophyticus]|uniref:Uncharacterized protein n=1 Tax=Microlunatus endophyticus TaxID=1716077 RepID=A0A917SF93_9ACTN|nr:hypothetical protein [Microlunatus endophyticus]GGL73064.1 hypothetical protein GCM10011575_34210 [Microlunatus endophyticus]